MIIFSLYEQTGRRASRDSFPRKTWERELNVIASETEWSEAISCFAGSYEIASSFVPHSSQ